MNYNRAACFWPMDIDKAVERGNTVLVYGHRFRDQGTPGDLQEIHDRITYYRQRGVDLWVIREKAAAWGDPSIGSPPAFDAKYASHFLALNLLDDEPEDKIPGLTFPNDADAIIAELVRVASNNWAYAQWLGVGGFVNVNGTHCGDGASKRLILTLDPYVLIWCQDNYGFTARQIRNHDGSLRYPESVVWSGSDFIRSLTHKPTWVTLETCNQQLQKPGDDAGGGLTYAGSRAPTADELFSWSAKAPDGILWFQEGAGTNDATEPGLESTIRTINAKIGGTVAPPLPAPVPPPPPPLNVPYGPFGLKATVDGQSVTLTWTGSPDPRSPATDYYRVESAPLIKLIPPDNAVIGPSSVLGTSTTTSFSTTLAPGSYSFRVFAVNAAGDSNPSAAPSVVTVTIPAPPAQTRRVEVTDSDGTKWAGELVKQ